MPTGDVHSDVEGRVYRVLSDLEEAGLGLARVGEVGVVVVKDPLTARGADAAFLLREQLPHRTSKEGYLLTPPALVAEVVSPNDRASEIQAKVLEYLKAGVKLVWVIDPGTRTVNVHLPDGNARTLQSNDVLWAPGVFPDLSVSVATLFKGLDRFKPVPPAQPDA
jgi:Uma2 family endonuclease